MSERQPLKKSIRVCGISGGKPFQRVFTIRKTLNEGASCICYEACHETSGLGVLKEFYPRDAYGLERNAEGQLVHAEEFRDAYDRYCRDKADYLETYRMLTDMKRSLAGQDLPTFIPAFEIYEGCDEDGTVIGTTYIWTEAQTLKTFEEVCAAVRKHPEDRSEEQLAILLSAIKVLAECVCALHRAELVHRDIKPANFGFQTRGGALLVETLSIFDIDSIRSVYGRSPDTVGTPGFMEPEASYALPNNQTDIYSIGATLFYAIVLTEETREKGLLFRSEDYDRIPELVDASLLLQASESNSHPRLRRLLAHILQKTLCKRDDRYPDCESLIRDLDKALEYARPARPADEALAGWEKNAFLAIMYHLYEHPLYESAGAEEGNLNVLVLGFGNHGQRFLDACLQTGQMRNKRLRVAVVTDEAADKDIYLSDRPALAQFFDVDGSLSGDADSYGEISFLEARIQGKNAAADKRAVRSILNERFGEEPPHYMFVALGEDEKNRAAANACVAAVRDTAPDCPVTFVLEEGAQTEPSSGRLYPLFIYLDSKTSGIHAEIERMAFNSHLVWEKDLDIDFDAVKAGFRKKYNHDSSVSNVLSLKYKLFSVGIDLARTDFVTAAGRFKAFLEAKANRDVKNELIWIEHRRWVAEKLCLGWTRLDRLEDCLTGATKDAKRKKHICILKSRPDQLLATTFSTNGNYAKWDTATDAELAQLDELDRMSVELHRMYAKKAKEILRLNPLSGGDLSEIRRLVEHHRRPTLAFQEWLTCLKDIANGDSGRVAVYRSLKEALLNASDELDDDQRQSLRGFVSAFDARFYPVLAATTHRDWKKDDVALVENIPFILTYTEEAYLVIPYGTGDNADVFENVSAATVVNPSNILYLYEVVDRQAESLLAESLPSVVGYMQKKHLRAVVDLVLIYSKPARFRGTPSFEETLREKGGKRIRSVKRLYPEGIRQLPGLLTPYLKQRAEGKRFFALEQNDTSLSMFLLGAGLYQTFPNYRFDSENARFPEAENAEMLLHIRKEPYITVREMVAFRLSSSESSNQPEFFADYKELWKKYCENRRSWKQLCDALGAYADEHDVLAVFLQPNPYDKRPPEPTEEYRFILPAFCGKAVDKIVRFLTEHGSLESGSRVTRFNSDACEAVILDRFGQKDTFARLFANVYKLTRDRSIDLFADPKSFKIKVRFDDLTVDSCVIPRERLAYVRPLLEFFAQKQYLIHLRLSDDGAASFTFASRPIKELLTTAGKMLEVYTYHKIKELGWFDDVVSSFEIRWEDSGVTNEFDIIVTKGFRSLFIECKARPELDQNYYFKIDDLTRHFGIHAKAVLISEAPENAATSEQRDRGDMLKVVTISRTDAIGNIGLTLKNVLLGKYPPKA